MAVTASQLRAMASLGLTHDQIVGVVEIMEACDGRHEQRHDESDDRHVTRHEGPMTSAERSKAYRNRKRDDRHVTERDGAVTQEPRAPADITSRAPAELILSSSEERKEERKEEKKDHAKTAKSSRGVTLPDDWKPKLAHYQAGEKLSLRPLDVERHAEDMRLWALANRNRQIARKADWDLTFHGWMRRNAQPRAGPSNGHQLPRPGSREDRLEKTANALAKLRQYAHSDADDDEAGGGPVRPAAGLLPFRQSR